MSDLAAEQLDIVTPALPLAFSETWRALEDLHGVARAVLRPIFARVVLGDTWVIAYVDGRAWSVIKCADPIEAARELWRKTGRRL